MFFFLNSCTYHKISINSPLPISDSIVLCLINDGQYDYNIIKKYKNEIDSAILIFDKNIKMLFALTVSSQKLDTIKISSDLFELKLKNKLFIEA